MQFVPNHRYAIHVWKIVPRNHVYGSCRFHMFMVHVERSGAVLPFFPRVSSQSPIPSSCLEYGGLQCSHIFIICCVLYCFQFSFMVYFISWCLLMCYLFSFIFIYVHLFSFMFIYFHLFSFIFIYCNFFSFFNFLFFFSLEKTITNLNHLHVDPRLSSADVILFSEPIPYVYIYIIRRTYSIFFETNCCLFLGKTCFEQGVI